MSPDRIAFRSKEILAEGTRLEMDTHRLGSGDSASPVEESSNDRKLYMLKLIIVLIAIALLVGVLIFALLLPGPGIIG